MNFQPTQATLCGHSILNLIKFSFIYSAFYNKIASRCSTEAETQGLKPQVSSFYIVQNMKNRRAWKRARTYTHTNVVSRNHFTADWFPLRMDLRKGLMSSRNASFHLIFLKISLNAWTNNLTLTANYFLCLYQFSNRHMRLHMSSLWDGILLILLIISTSLTHMRIFAVILSSRATTRILLIGKFKPNYFVVRVKVTLVSHAFHFNAFM